MKQYFFEKIILLIKKSIELNYQIIENSESHAQRHHHQQQ